MQSDLPQGDPRLQPTDPGHATVAVRSPQSCIVYLESTLPGEIPLLGACWARNSREIREPNRPSYIELQSVTVFQNQPNHKRLWNFSQEYSRSVYLIHSPSPTPLAKLAYAPSNFKSAPDPIFKWVVRQLDNETLLALRRVQSDFPNDLKAMVSAILRESCLDWPSIADARAYLEKSEIRTRPTRRPSLVGRAISSVFKKKPQPVHA